MVSIYMFEWVRIFIHTHRLHKNVKNRNITLCKGYFAFIKHLVYFTTIHIFPKKRIVVSDFPLYIILFAVERTCW